MTSLIEYTEQLIAKLQGVLDGFRQNSRPELETTLQRWQDQLQQMRGYAEANQTVSIAFVGGTGAGKSTLINALLGDDLLPTHSFKTCTSAAIAVSHASRKTYQATLEFLPLSAWEEEKEHFLAEIHQSEGSGHSTFVHQDFLYKAWSLYRPRKGQPPMPFPLEQLLELLKEPLPQTLREHLDKGQLQLKEKSAPALKAELTRFLTAESPIWPMIRQVRITGPFAPLQDGLELVDLPGLNDPNPVREAITHRYLKSADFLWLIFGTGRGLTREVMDLMKDQTFVNQIVLDGKVSALAFVGTRADDFVPEMERSALNLPMTSDLEAVRQARETMIRQQIQQQLSELTLWFGNRYKLSPQASEVIGLIARTLHQSPIHLTSALSWLALSGRLPAGTARFEQAEQCGIPGLQHYMQEIVSEHGVKARKKLIRSQFQQMNQEIRRLIESLRHRQSLRQQGLASNLAARLEQLEQEQLRQLVEINQELEQKLKLKKIQFEKHMLYAFSDLQHRLEPLHQRWSELNWQHLQRAVREQGRYSSPRTGAHLDLVKDVQGFVETEVALEWYDFFQHRLLSEIDQAQALISGLLEQSCQLAIEKVSEHAELVSRFRNFRDQGLEILREQSYRSRRELEGFIRDLQRQIGHLLEHMLHKELQSVFAEAAGFSGTGLKGQILDVLETGLQRALPAIGKRFEPELASLLEQLSQGISKHQQALNRILREQLEMICRTSAENPSESALYGHSGQ